MSTSYVKSLLAVFGIFLISSAVHAADWNMLCSLSNGNWTLVHATASQDTIDKWYKETHPVDKKVKLKKFSETMKDAASEDVYEFIKQIPNCRYSPESDTYTTCPRGQTYHCGQNDGGARNAPSGAITAEIPNTVNLTGGSVKDAEKQINRAISGVADPSRNCDDPQNRTFGSSWTGKECWEEGFNNPTHDAPSDYHPPAPAPPVVVPAPVIAQQPPPQPVQPAPPGNPWNDPGRTCSNPQYQQSIKNWLENGGTKPSCVILEACANTYFQGTCNYNSCGLDKCVEAYHSYCQDGRVCKAPQAMGSDGKPVRAPSNPEIQQFQNAERATDKALADLKTAMGSGWTAFSKNFIIMTDSIPDKTNPLWSNEYDQYCKDPKPCRGPYTLDKLDVALQAFGAPNYQDQTPLSLQDAKTIAAMEVRLGRLLDLYRKDPAAAAKFVGVDPKNQAQMTALDTFLHASEGLSQGQASFFKFVKATNGGETFMKPTANYAPGGDATPDINPLDVIKNHNLSCINSTQAFRTGDDVKKADWKAFDQRLQDDQRYAGTYANKLVNVCHFSPQPNKGTGVTH